MTIFCTGQNVTIECGGQTVPGSIVLASSNGRSLMLGFDAVLDGHVGMMPVLQDEHGVFSAIMSGTVVRIHARQ